MSAPLISKRKSDAISNGVFLIGLGILFYTNMWWPGILLAIWAALAIRQYFTGRTYDLIISSVILIGLFILNAFDLTWSVLMPVLFVIGGIYIIFREYFFAEEECDKSEEIQDQVREIKDDIDDRKHKF